MRHWPNTILFLGYDPMQKPQTFGQQLIAYRRRNGLSRKALANSLQIDEATLWRWETDERKPSKKEQYLAIKLLAVI